MNKADKQMVFHPYDFEYATSFEMASPWPSYKLDKSIFHS